MPTRPRASGSLRDMRSARGQATPEYVALVLVVAVVLGTAAGVTSGGLGGAVVNGVRRGLCAVGGRTCAPLPVAADLPPCLVRARERRSDTRVALSVLDAGRDRGIRVDRFSDGHVEVTFSDGRTAGLVAEVGRSLQGGDTRADASAQIGVRVHVEGGRTWRFAGARAAEAFVRHWGGRQRALDGLVHDTVAACLLCRVLGHAPAEPPPPDVTWHGRGHAVEAGAALGGFGLRGEVAATAERQTVGVREERGGGRTRFLVLGEGLRAAVQGLGRDWAGAERSSLVAELHTDARGRADRLTLRALTATGRDGAEGIEEREWSLPVGGAEDLGAVRRLVAGGLVGGWLPRSRLGTLLALRAFLARVRAHGTLTIRRRRARERTGGGGIVATAFGLSAGLVVSRDDRGETLVSEEVALPGRPALPRDDCLGPA